MDPKQQPPVAVATVSEVINAIEDPNASASSIAAVVSSDPGLATRTLGLANSAFYGLSRQVSDIRLAVSMVGAEMVRTLAIGGATGMLDSSCGLPRLRDHALEVAAAARLLAPRVSVPTSDAFTAGLLHDLGELLMWQDDTANYLRILDSVDDDPAAQLALERDLYGSDHASLAAERLFLWRIPEPIVDAVGEHHEPAANAANLTVVVAAADELTRPGAGTALGLLGIDEAAADELRAVIQEEQVELRGLLVGA